MVDYQMQDNINYLPLIQAREKTRLEKDIEMAVTMERKYSQHALSNTDLLKRRTLDPFKTRKEEKRRNPH